MLVCVFGALNFFSVIVAYIHLVVLLLSSDLQLNLSWLGFVKIADGGSRCGRKIRKILAWIPFCLVYPYTFNPVL